MYKHINKLKSKYHTSNPYELAQAMHIQLTISDLGDNIRGFCMNWKRGTFISLNSQLSEFDMIFVLWHEIGHTVLHKNMNRVFMDKYTLNIPSRYENEANLFAAYMMIDDSDIKEYIEREYTIYQISQITGIKPDLVEKRINGYLEQK